MYVFDSMSSYSLELPIELVNEAKKMASDRNIGWEQWLVSAIQERIQSEHSFDIICSYADRFDPEAFDAVMAKVPGDELWTVLC